MITKNIKNIDVVRSTYPNLEDGVNVDIISAKGDTVIIAAPGEDVLVRLKLERPVDGDVKAATINITEGTLWVVYETNARHTAGSTGCSLKSMQSFDV